MKNGLNRKTFIEPPGKAFLRIAVYDVRTKEVVFTGTTKEVMKFCNMKNSKDVDTYLKKQVYTKEKIRI